MRTLPVVRMQALQERAFVTYFRLMLQAELFFATIVPSQNVIDRIIVPSAYAGSLFGEA